MYQKVDGHKHHSLGLRTWRDECPGLACSRAAAGEKTRKHCQTRQLLQWHWGGAYERNRSCRSRVLPVVAKAICCFSQRRRQVSKVQSSFFPPSPATSSSFVIGHWSMRPCVTGLRTRTVRQSTVFQSPLKARSLCFTWHNNEQQMSLCDIILVTGDNSLLSKPLTISTPNLRKVLVIRTIVTNCSWRRFMAYGLIY